MTQTRNLADPVAGTTRDQSDAGMLDSEAHAELAARYRTLVEAGNAPALAELYELDALFDAHVPGWRYQVQGRERAAQQACVLPRPGRFTSFEVEPTARGLLVQFEWRQDTPGNERVVRQLQAWQLADARIAEQTLFCAGIWDRALQDRMARESPLVRP